jgi:hypothetical protein
MSVKELTTILLIALADMVTTYYLMITHSTCSIERNPLLRGLCNEIGYGATWIWLPAEFTIISLVYEALKRLRKKLRALIEVEKIFLVLILTPIINNLIHLIRTL